MTTNRNRHRDEDENNEESVPYDHSFEFTCPHCGEVNALTIEGEPSEEELIQDCEVCCNPITIRITREVDGEYSLDVTSEE